MKSIDGRHFELFRGKQYKLAYGGENYHALSARKNQRNLERQSEKTQNPNEYREDDDSIEKGKKG